MDSKKIFLVNLAKGYVGEDGANLLGGLLLSSFASASYTRIDTKEHKRIPFIIYLDEFQNYTTGSIAGMVAELRKFKVSFVFAHQYIAQLETDIRNAVLGNIGTIICFTLGQADAKYMEREFYPIFTAQDFINLPHYSISIKLLIRGETSQGFSARTITIYDHELRRLYEGGG
jgi:hypothetical protein